MQSSGGEAQLRVVEGIILYVSKNVEVVERSLRDLIFQILKNRQ